MLFQIEKLIIWPKNSKFPPREVGFEINKLNVITGESRSGKSAIIPIIDYCLASGSCVIPIDTIRDSAKWYGIQIKTEDENLLIARMVPQGKIGSNDFYILRGNDIIIPSSIEEPNSREKEIKLILNKIITAPFFSLGTDNDQNFGARLSIRDLVALNFQSQDIVANQNILFYKTHAHEHREKLRNWFPYIIGAETLETLNARHDLKEIESQLKKLEQEYESLQNIVSSWRINLYSQLRVADEYGLLFEEITSQTSIANLIEIAKDILQSKPNSPRTNESNIEAQNNELADLEEEIDELSVSISITQKRLKEIEQLRTSFISYGGDLRKRSERLHLSKWIVDVASQKQACPVCGEDNHKNTIEEIKKISKSFEEIENKAKKTTNVPSSFEREELFLKKELNSVLNKRAELQNRQDILISKDKEAKKEFHKRKEMFFYLGELKKTIEVINSIDENGNLLNKIEKLKEKQADLQNKANRDNVRKLISKKSNEISQKVLNYLKTLDVELKYKNIPPQFSIEDLTMQVQSDEGNWHYLAEVGSASNWVSFHIALFCALHEFFLELKSSVVPGFVIFDQPSQVYFPKVKRGENIGNDVEYEDVDIEAVKNIFKTISLSLKNCDWKWQAIVLDHADQSIYGDIDNVYEVEEWRNGKKLIPKEWYEE